VSDDRDLLSLLGRRFPSLRAADGAERLERLGAYAAGLWAAGRDALRRCGVPASAELHTALAGVAAGAARGPGGGVAFLAELRAALGDDEPFVAVVRALAQAQARADSRPVRRPDPPPADGRVEVAGFEVHDLLGEGNMGRVYKARQKSLDRLVALKVLNRSLSDEDATFVARFEAEAKAAARLQHPNVVGVIDQGTCPRTGVQFIAFELIDGQTARQMVEAQGSRLEEKEALAIVLAVAEALTHAEEHGIVHRDVKPDNILIGKDGTPKLADLGLAKRLRDGKELTDPSLVVGTPHYIAPEQALGLERIDVRADLYSLGVVLYRFVTGTFPFDSATSLGVITRHINEDLPDPRDVDPRTSSATARLIAALAARERDDRYRTARAAADDIQRVLSGRSPLGPAHEETGRRASPTGRIRLGAGSGLWAAVSEDEAFVPVAVTPPAGLSVPDQAVWTYRRTGDPSRLDAAEARYQLSADSSDPAVAARGLAGLAEVAALRGRAGEAADLCGAALGKDAGCREALSVLAGVAREEPAQASLTGALIRLSSLVAAGRLEDAAAEAARFRRDHPGAPHPHLALALIAREGGDEPAFREALQVAWALFPALEHARHRLGSGVDARLAEVLVERGREALASGDPARLAETLEGLDDRTNLTAGALRLGIAVAHAALAAAGAEPGEVRRLLRTLARGLAGLQHFKHAREVLDRVDRHGPEPDEVQLLDEDRRQLAGYAEVQRPGIQPRRGRYACPVGKELLDRLKARLQALGRSQRERRAELEAAAGELAALVLEDEGAAAEVRAAAAARQLEDPLRPVRDVEAELLACADAQAELAESAAAEEPSGGGLFSRLKGAAGMASRAARHGELKLRETQLRSRRAKAVAALGRAVASDLADHPFEGERLSEVARRARRVGAILAHEAAEMQDLQEVLRRLAG